MHAVKKAHPNIINMFIPIYIPTNKINLIRNSTVIKKTTYIHTPLLYSCQCDSKCRSISHT